MRNTHKTFCLFLGCVGYPYGNGTPLHTKARGCILRKRAGGITILPDREKSNSAEQRHAHRQYYNKNAYLFCHNEMSTTFLRDACPRTISTECLETSK